jgi:hypothetical protein
LLEGRNGVEPETMTETMTEDMSMSMQMNSNTKARQHKQGNRNYENTDSYDMHLSPRNINNGKLGP